MDLFVGFSQDGISWKIQDEPISFEGDPVAVSYTHLGFTKGMVYINGFHLGRYWSCGPQRTLYLPGVLLHTDRRNEVVVLELEDCAQPVVRLTDTHCLG